MTQAQESKIEATDRLRREGRWSEASRYRDRVRQELRQEGETKAEANEAAWEAMLVEFPPSEAIPGPENVPEGEDYSEALERLRTRTEGQEPDLSRDSLWVYDNLENKLATPDQAPSVGAWSLLIWARSGGRNRFFESFLPKALPVKSATAAGTADEEPSGSWH